MLVLYSAYKRVALIGMNTVAERLGDIISLVRLFCRLKVTPLVCFGCHAITTASSKTCRAVLPILSPVCFGLCSD